MEVKFFNATWCGPCQQMKPHVDKLNKEGYSIEDLFNKIYNSLKKEGYFIFSTFFNDEISIDVDDSGNFKHSHGYISKISNNCNFKICKYSVNVHEINYGAKKKARVYILKK